VDQEALPPWRLPCYKLGPSRSGIQRGKVKLRKAKLIKVAARTMGKMMMVWKAETTRCLREMKMAGNQEWKWKK